MLHQPIFGATIYAIKLGVSSFQEGWNVIHRPDGSGKPTSYMYVSSVRGKLTQEKPDVPEEDFNHVHDDQVGSLQETLAWQQLCKLQDGLRYKGKTIPNVERILAHADHIGNYPIAGSTHIVENHLARVQQHVHAISSRSCSLKEFWSPVKETTLAFLDLKESGDHAAQVLAWTLKYYSQLPSPLAAGTDADRWMLCADHLRDTAYTLLRDRDNHSLAGFLDMTYLASLYGNAAYQIYDDLVDSGLLSQQECLVLAKRRLALDEKMAHDLGPTLLHPVTYMPCGTMEYFVSREGFVPKTGLYPGAAGAPQDPFAVEVVWPAIQEHSRKACEALSHEELVDSYSPIPTKLQEHIQDFLLAMSAGRQIL